MIDYGEFLAGLSKGLQALWQPDFMTGVRNGGFEQTLRNVCIPHIERATGKMAFTESRGRADLLLCGDEADTCTRCEFKVNFAPQYGEILKRKREAIDQVRTQAGYRIQDGIVVYAIAELIHAHEGLLGKAERHNDHVASTSYKLFQSCDASSHDMEKARERLETEFKGKQVSTPAFAPLFSRDGISFEWEKNWARLHVWTHHDT
jgi:hypothetical protein